MTCFGATMWVLVLVLGLHAQHRRTRAMLEDDAKVRAWHERIEQERREGELKSWNTPCGY